MTKINWKKIVIFRLNTRLSKFRLEMSTKKIMGKYFQCF